MYVILKCLSVLYLISNVISVTRIIKGLLVFMQRTYYEYYGTPRLIYVCTLYIYLRYQFHISRTYLND